MKYSLTRSASLVTVTMVEPGTARVPAGSGSLTVTVVWSTPV